MPTIPNLRRLALREAAIEVVRWLLWMVAGTGPVTAVIHWAFHPPTLSLVLFAAGAAAATLLVVMAGIPHLGHWLRQRRDKTEAVDDPVLAEVVERARQTVALQEAKTELYDARAELDKAKPLAGWASELIAHEREHPFAFVTVTAQISGGSHLLDDNPHIDVILNIAYRGVLRLVIGESITGRLVYHEPLSEPPEPSSYLGGKLPVELSGPDGGSIRLKQYLNGPTRDRIVEWLDGGFREIEFTHELTISFRSYRFDGEAVHDGELPLGTYFSQDVKQPWRDGLE